MIKMTRLLGIALALVFAASPVIAQQGEGTGGDFSLRTRRNTGAINDVDKFLCVGDAFSVRFDSGSIINSGVAAFGDISPVSIDILEDVGGLGLGIGTGINRFVVFDGISDPLGPALVGGALNLSFAVPASQDWIDGGAFANNPDVAGGVVVADDWGFFLQGVVVDPSGPLGVQISNTIKHEVGNELSEGFSDTCADALLCDGLSDLDLGVPQTVDTSNYQNNTTIDPLGAGFDAQLNNGEFLLGDELAGFPRALGNDAFISFTTATGGNFQFSLCGSAYDSSVILIADDCSTGLGFNDDGAVCGGLESQFDSFAMSAGQTILIGVDGFGATSNGLAELIITKLADFGVDGQDINSGSRLGGQTLTFTGTGLDLVTGVTIGGNAATLGAQAPGSLSVTVPAGTTGSADIVLTDGTDSVTITGGFLYLATFDVTGQDITTGDIAGGETVTLTGTGLDNVTDVTFGGVSGTLNLVDPMTLEVTVPAGAAGAVDIVVTDGVDTQTFANGWLYVDNSLPSFLECNTPGIIYGDSTQAGDTGSVVQDTLTVTAGAGATIVDATFDLDITHTFQGDNEIDVTSPAATTLRLWDGAGGSADDIVGNFPVDFDVAATGDGVGMLADFTGEDPNGVWTLDINDTFPGSDGGTLNMWCVGGTIAFAQQSGTSTPGIIYGDSTQAGDTGSVVSDAIALGTTTVNSLSVDLDITHTFQGDNEIDLTSPAATTIRLWDGAGGSADDIVGNFPVDFDIASTGDGVSTLADFNGEDSTGNWTLDINDTFPGSDGGTLNSWGLTIN